MAAFLGEVSDADESAVVYERRARGRHKLNAGYGDVTVVRDLNLRVDAGEVVALLGRNGAGKTTALLTMAGALTPLGGEIHSRADRPGLAGWSGSPGTRVDD